MLMLSPLLPGKNRQSLMQDAIIINTDCALLSTYKVLVLHEFSICNAVQETP